MSETQDPETLGSGYNISAGVGYPSQPVTPSSTVQDASNSNLPSFGTTFTGDIDPSTGYPTERLLDISNWDYYEGLSGRLLERTENGLSIITSQPQYRPWESKPVDSTSQDSLRPTFATTAVNTFADAFAAQNGGSKLPSFQSQFQSFNDPSSTTTTESNLTTLTNLTPVSPNSSNSSPQLQSLTNFHTLNPARNYPLVPAPIQAREIPSIQQQFLDERHIQLFHPTTNLTLNNTIHPTNIFQGQNGTTIIQNNQHHHLIQAPTVVTVLKSEQVNHVDLKLHTVPLQSEGLKIQNIGLHPTQFQNPMSTILDNVSYNGLIEKKINGFAMGSPTRSDFRKKERRKIRASSLESSATESDGASSNMEISSENSGQVAAISSTAGFKSPHHQAMPTNGGGMEVDHEISGGNGDKQVKKKRKRCGECIGCQRKDNCGDCAPCRNDKSHQICKQRRCEKLTEKKNLYNDGSFGRTEARRGRGKGRGSGTYRGRKPAGGVSIAAASSTVAASEPSPQPTSRPSPQPPLTMLKPDPATVQQPMAPMPFYADPNRFPAPVWQADPQGWAQGQFIQQIPHAPQPTLEGYPQQYPNPIYQATYQQPGFDTNTFYTGPVQVLTNQRPPSTPNHAPLTPRTNGTYTPSPSPIGQPQQNGHRTNISSGQYAQEYPTAGQTFVAPATTPTLESGTSISRPNSVGSNSFTGNVQQTFSTSSNFSPVSNAPPSYVGSNMSTQTGSGNGKPGYPQVNSSPQLASHNSNNSGYSGGQFSGQNQNAMPSNDSQSWASPEQDRTTWEQAPNTGYVQMQPQMTTLPQGQMTIQGQQIHQGHVQTQQNSHLQQSPNAQTQQQQQQQQQSSQLQNHQLQQQQNNANQIQNQQMLNNQISNENFSQSDRVNLNSRIKTMILNKQQSIDGKPEEGQRVEGNQTGHFLSYSHHRRMNYYSDGGGPYDYPSGAAAPSPLENFVKFANNENYPANKWNDQPKQFYQTDKKVQNVKVENYFGYKDEPYYQKSPVLEKKYQPTSEELANFERQTKYQTTNEEIANFERQKKYQPANEEITNFERQKKYQPSNEEIANFERQKKYQPVNEEIANFERQKKYQPANEEIANFERQKKYQPTNEEIANFERQKKYQPVNEEIANFDRQKKYQPTHEEIVTFEQQKKYEDFDRQKKELNIPKFGYQENPYYQKPPITDKKYDTPPQNFDRQKKEIVPKLEHPPDPFQERQTFPEHFQYPEAQYKIEPDQKCGTKLPNPYHNFGQETPAIPKIEEPYKTTLAEIKLEKEAYIFEGDGGPACFKPQNGSWCCRQGGTEPPTPEHLRDGSCLGLQTQDEISLEQSAENNKDGKKGNNNDVKNEKTNTTKEFTDNIEKLKNNVKTEVPDCSCFPPDKNPPEPGSYYTHLGCASNLTELRKELENRIGISGKALRIEKICYTGKEGKTTQGCPMAKWIIRRTSYEEKVLAIVKHRQGHTCVSAVIVVCMVAWDGIPPTEADQAYNLLTHKLNRYGLPTTRRCATNEPRTCACQGLDPDTCGASFSFGCSWSMYYNGCKYARSKTVRKFRLSVKSEENEIEERMHVLATLLSPLYSTIAPDAFKNQCQFEREAPECRLGFKTGRPFSGVTACMDFTSHSHRDLHNMNNGCTVVATLTKHRSLAKPNDEQLHVLPLYVIDDSDEFGSKEAQQEKFKNGSIEVLSKYPCEVRVRSVPLQPCRRHGKKRKEDEPDAIIGKKDLPATPRGASPRSANHGSPRSQTPVAHHQTPLIDMVSMLDNFTDAQLQSSQVSSTVLDSPTMYPSWNYENSLLNNQNMQYGAQNQMYQSNQNWLESQKRQNMYLNGWGEYPGNFYKDGIKEDPDSTTQIPVANPEEKAINPPDSSTMMAANANFEDKNRSYVNTPGLPSPNGKAPNYPNPVQQPTWEDPNYNRVRNPYSVPNQNQCVQQQSVPNVPKSPESVRKPKQNWPTADRSNWEQANMQTAGPNDTSPFRIPKARPPSRSQTNSAPSPDTNVQTPTFLKPYPPDKNRHTPEVNLDTKANMAASKPMENIQSPWPEELKSNLSDFHAATNYLNQSYANTNYGNISTPFTSYNPYNTYDTSQMNYDYQYAEKLKREEYIRNTTCYNSYGYQNYPNWCHQNQSNWVQNTPNWCLYPPFGLPLVPEQPKSEPIGEVTDFIDNLECFKDSQMGGVAIALGHGSVLFECAKHEMHSTTALRKPNRLSPTRISLVFYQHRNLNKPKHGLDEWEEKMRLRKLGITTTSGGTSTTNTQSPSNQTASEKAQADKEKGVEMAELVKSCTNKNSRQVMMRAPTLTTMSWTTLFPMHPCMVTGPYQEGGAVG